MIDRVKMPPDSKAQTEEEPQTRLGESALRVLRVINLRLKVAKSLSDNGA